MPVTFHQNVDIEVNATSTSLETAGVNISAGTDLHLLAAVCFRSSTGDISECRHGGSGGTLMTQVGELVNAGAHVALFELDNPTTGSSLTLYAAHSAAASRGFGVAGSVYAGVGSVASFTSASGTGTSSSGITVSGVTSDDMVFDGVQPENADAHAGYETGQTERNDESWSPSQISLSTSDRDGVDGNTMGRSWTLSDVWVHCGVRLVAAGGGGSSIPVLSHNRRQAE